VRVSVLLYCQFVFQISPKLTIVSASSMTMVVVVVVGGFFVVLFVFKIWCRTNGMMICERGEVGETLSSHV